MSKKRLLAVALVAFLVMSGCAALPQSGVVTAADPDLPPSRQLSLTASGPVEGAGVEQIVRDFLRACSAGYSDDFAVARSYLGGDAVAHWRPEAQVRVYPTDAALQLGRTANGAVTVQVNAEGSVDEDGHFQDIGAANTISTTFSLAKNAEGQWRIAQLDDGLILSRSAFSNAYTAAPLYFLSPDHRVSVADTRWYPRRRLPTHLVQGLLKGPSSWLSQAVVTAFPSGTHLPLNSVEITDGLVSVDLSNEALSASLPERALMLAQLQLTLSSAPAVRQVSMTVAGSPFDTGEPANIDTITAGERMVMIDKGNLVADIEGGARSLLPATALPTPLTYPASNSELHPVAFLSGDTVYGLSGRDIMAGLTASDATAVKPLFATPGLLPPVVDRLGWVWAASTLQPGHLYVTRLDAAGTVIDLAVPWLKTGVVESFNISGDGTRLLVVRRVDDATVVSVGAVKRSGQGVVQGIGESVRVGESVSQVKSAQWVGSDTIMALGSAGKDSGLNLYSMGVGEPLSKIMTAVPEITALLGGIDELSVLAADARGGIYARSGSNWRKVSADMWYPSFAG